MRLAVIAAGGLPALVANVVLGDADYQDPTGLKVVPSDIAGIGWSYDGRNFAAPPVVVAPAITVAALIAYAEGKQTAVLEALQVTYALKDGSATLTTMCGATSITFLNSLGTWVALNAAASPEPTRVYYNLDGSSNALNPAQLAEFLNAVGARVQATFDALAKVRSAIGANPPTITTLAQVDGAAWPTS